MPIPVNTADDALFRPKSGYYLIMGPPKRGKTFGAARVSALFPKDRLKMRGLSLVGLPRVMLEDVLELAVDLGATSGLESLGIVVPTLDIRELCDQAGPAVGWRRIPELFEKAKQRYPYIKHVILDTVSALDDTMYAWWHENMPKSERQKDDTQAMWTGLASSHTHWREYITKAAMAAFGARPIILSHTTPKYKGQGDRAKVQERKMEAEGIDDGELIPAITGKSGSAYIKDADMVLWCDYEEALNGPLAGKPEGRSYYFYREHANVAAFNRFAAVLPDKWEADMGLTLEMIGRRAPKAP